MNLIDAARGMLLAYEATPTLDLDNDEVVLVDLPEGQRVAYILGSNDKADWWENIDAIPASYEDGHWYHRGFLGSAKALMKPVLEMNPTTIVGHSRGAAVAAIISRVANIPAMVFASPRPIWLGWEKLGVPCICVQASDDPICNLPSRWLGFRHAGTSLWFPGQPPTLHERHRMRWYIERLEQSRFGTMTPFSAKAEAVAVGSWSLKDDPDGSVA